MDELTTKISRRKRIKRLSQEQIIALRIEIATEVFHNVFGYLPPLEDGEQYSTAELIVMLGKRLRGALND